MRTPFKTLTVGLVLVTASVAGCSSTTGSSGAVQNAATAPASSAAAASSAASNSPAPSPDPVTPTAEPTEAPASPVASPTDSPSPTGSSSAPAPLMLGKQPENNDECDSDLAYACGDFGASGVGIVFYASSTAFACGESMASSCNFLEVAPQRWNGTLFDCKGGCGGSPNMTSDWGGNSSGKTRNVGNGYRYCDGDGGTAIIPNASGTVLGSGFTNTSAMLTMCRSATWETPNQYINAANAVRGYTGGAQTDWSLPSKDELNALYYYPNRNAIGGFTSSTYWSSSQDGQYNAWGQDFSNNPRPKESFDKDVSFTFGVRPIRAF